MQHVFIIGSKGIPAKYGGFETFVDNLTKYKQSESIKYHIACAVDETPSVWEFEYNDAHCFNILRKKIGHAQAVTYDLDALNWALSYIDSEGIKHPIIYILACRIGPFVSRYEREVHKRGGLLFVNPDGHEWMRSKWNKATRRYWKISEGLMVKAADLVICDSRNIESYINNEYASYKPMTTYISYGATVSKSSLSDDDPKWTAWMQCHNIIPFEYYLVVGRFVPENNYETIIREFIRSGSRKSLVLVTDIEKKFFAELERRTGFSADSRIKFVGTVYDQELLTKIRENAFAYLHGHEVGGTNPSLLEALASTQLNLLLDVGFNREVAEEAAMYWSKSHNMLANLIDAVENKTVKDFRHYDSESTKRIENAYSWSTIIKLYESLITASFPMT